MPPRNATYARFGFHSERCVGCGCCVTACLDAHSTDLDFQPPYRRIHLKESVQGGKVHLEYYSVACMHCKDAPCAKPCPKHCFVRDERTGTTVLDNAKCIGCRQCARVCPYEALGFDKDGKAQKCDGCRALLERGQLPVCVTACPRKAITIDEVNDVLRAGRSALLKLVHAQR